MLKKYWKIIIVVVFILAVLTSVSAPALAGASIVPEEGKATGDYNFNDFVLLAVNIARWILGIVGSLTLLFFVYGGFTFIFSGGNSETVSKGKAILINSIIGLIIVFASYLIIQFSLTALGVVPAQDGSWFQTGWFK